MKRINILGITLEDLTENYLVAFDTNVILDIYKKGNMYKKNLFAILNELKLLNTLWIPNQVKEEFFKNKISALKSSKKKLEQINKYFLTIENEINKMKESPFVDINKLSLEYTNFRYKINNQILKTNNNDLFNSDDCFDEDIIEIFNGICGKSFSELEFTKLYKEGEERYMSNIPPGYKDSNKYHLKEKYGDLIIWFELIKVSKNINKNIIFVTGDLKDDWWEIDSNKNKIIKSELKLEFTEKTNNNFLLLNIDDFLELDISRKHIIAQYKKELLVPNKYEKNNNDNIFNTLIDNLILLSSIENKICSYIDNNSIKSKFSEIDFTYISFTELAKWDLLYIKTSEIKSNAILIEIDRLIINYFKGKQFQDILDNMTIYKNTLKNVYSNLISFVNENRVIKK